MWRQILTLNHEPKVVIDSMEFDYKGRFLEKIDLQGLPITATSLEWPPYISIENCNNIGTNCSKSGYLVEFMDIWARELNFTWDIYADINNSWGLDPIEGKTHSYSRGSSRSSAIFVPNSTARQALHTVAAYFKAMALSKTKYFFQKGLY